MLHVLAERRFLRRCAVRRASCTSSDALSRCSITSASSPPAIRCKLLGRLVFRNFVDIRRPSYSPESFQSHRRYGIPELVASFLHRQIATAQIIPNSSNEIWVSAAWLLVDLPLYRCQEISPPRRSKWILAVVEGRIEAFHAGLDAAWGAERWKRGRYSRSGLA